MTTRPSPFTSRTPPRGPQPSTASAATSQTRIAILSTSRAPSLARSPRSGAERARCQPNPDGTHRLRCRLVSDPRHAIRRARQMSDRRVSILVPCYQQAHLLPQAVESALAQTAEDVEIVIVNDGSTDETHEV